MTNHQRNIFVAALATAVLALGGGATYLYLADKDSDDLVATTTTTGSSATANNTGNGADTTTSTKAVSTKDSLLYLIEEEKLAHDIYTKLYEKWGARVFGNILQSESTHQSRVLTLLDAHNIDDPRATQVGVFSDQDLQALYDQLLAKGLKSETDAYEVGVAIEEKDIADIGDLLGTVSEDDTDVIATLEALRQGSENHLRAFNRQLR